MIKFFSLGLNDFNPVKLHAVTTQPKVRRMKALSTFALIFALLSFGAFNAFPQAETGPNQLEPSSTLPGRSFRMPRVTVRSIATGAERTSTTSDSGAFTFPNLQPDVYEVSVTAPGFNTLRQQATVTVGAKIGLDLKLEIGQAATVVEVEASAERPQP